MQPQLADASTPTPAPAAAEAAQVAHSDPDAIFKMFNDLMNCCMEHVSRLRGADDQMEYIRSAMYHLARYVPQAPMAVFQLTLPGNVAQFVTAGNADVWTTNSVQLFGLDISATIDQNVLNYTRGMANLAGARLLLRDEPALASKLNLGLNMLHQFANTHNFDLHALVRHASSVSDATMHEYAEKARPLLSIGSRMYNTPGMGDALHANPMGVAAAVGPEVAREMMGMDVSSNQIGVALTTGLAAIQGVAATVQNTK